MESIFTLSVTSNPKVNEFLFALCPLCLSMPCTCYLSHLKGSPFICSHVVSITLPTTPHRIRTYILFFVLCPICNSAHFIQLALSECEWCACIHEWIIITIYLYIVKKNLYLKGKGNLHACYWEIVIPYFTLSI